MENEKKPSNVPLKDWEEAQKLSDIYLVPSECIVRGFQACDMCGISRDVYIDIYLKKTSPERDSELSAAYMQILKKERERNWINKK